ncbi:MAG: hypothetical protein FWG54_06885 [Bacteroidetes bacterium]|nr:hypothetical protein [Bacteroidota bacterium]
MKHTSLFCIIGFLLLVSTGCVEQTGKYKRLQAQLDSIQVATTAKDAELDEAFATLNEIEQGLKSIRETENLLKLQSVQGGEISASVREQMKSDIQYIAATMAAYKAQITKLEQDKKYQSAQFQKRLQSITAELESKTRLIEDLSRQLDEKDRLLVIKTEQIISMDQSIAMLKNDLIQLEQSNVQQLNKISELDRQMYSGYYIIGNKSELIAAQVLSKGGLFRAAKVSYQAEKSAFRQIDIRRIFDIPLEAKKAKVLSIHPTGTYSLDSDDNGLLTLHIVNPNSFWEQTKYAVIKID